jgi:hypothetical protein
VNANFFENHFYVTVISYPLNLTLSLGDESPFWSYPGELTGVVTVYDFSEKLNGYLESCRSQKDSVKCEIPLKFHSDSPGGLKIEEEDIDLNLIWKNPNLNWENPSRISDSGGKTPVISFDGSREKVLFEIESSTKSIESIKLISLNFNCKGNFSNEFIDDNWSNVENNMGVILSTGMNIGLRLNPSQNLHSIGVDLYLSKRDKDIKFVAEMTEDKNGKPGEENILSSKNVELSSEQDGWICVKFDEPVPLDKEKTYWLVLKAGIGEVEWFCSEDRELKRKPDGFIFRKEPTGVWKSYSLNNQIPLIGYFRLKYLPDSENDYPISLEIKTQSGDLMQSKDLKPTAEPEFVNINFEEISLKVQGSMARLDLEIASRASGKLELSDIAIEGKEVS